MQNIQEAVKIEPLKIKKISKTILRLLGLKNAVVSIVIVDNTAIQRLNREYRGINRPTDILSFSQLEGEYNNLTPELLGDIVISAEQACNQAKKDGNNINSEITFLLIHGILHLIGYDHEKSKDKGDIMRAKETELFKTVKDEFRL